MNKNTFIKEICLDFIFFAGTILCCAITLTAFSDVAARESVAQRLKKARIEEARVKEIATEKFNMVTAEDMKRAIDEHIEDKEAFANEFLAWKKDMDGQVEPMLEEMGGIINNYAENTKPFDESYYDLFDELSAFSDKLNAMIFSYPQLDNLIKVVEPHVLKVENQVKKEMPGIPKATQGYGNPFVPVVDFYRAAEKRNLLNTGPFFEIDMITE